MAALTICAKCKHYSAAIYRAYPILIDFPAWCWHTNEEPRLDCVTGKNVGLVPIRCSKKNNGQCLEYEFKPLLAIVQDEPRKHWWQK